MCCAVDCPATGSPTLSASAWSGFASRAGAALLLSGLALAACQHRVQLEAPKEPIVINLNVKVEQEVRVKVEEDVEDLFEDNEDIF